MDTFERVSLREEKRINNNRIRGKSIIKYRFLGSLSSFHNNNVVNGPREDGVWTGKPAVTDMKGPGVEWALKRPMVLQVSMFTAR